MSTSYSERTPLSCPTCGTDFTATLWLIVHAEERPDLIARIAELHRVSCPVCRAVSMVNMPTLIFRPGEVPHLIYSPAKADNDEQYQEMTTELIDRLRTSLSVRRGAPWFNRLGAWLSGQKRRDEVHWQDDWVREMLVVPRARLAHVLSVTSPRRGEIVGGTASLAGPGPTKGKVIHGLPPEVSAGIDLAYSKADLFRETGDLGALDEAIAAWNRVIGSPAIQRIPLCDRVRIWNDAGPVFLWRHRAIGNPGDLERAVTLWTDAVQSTPSESPDLPAMLNNLGLALRTRYAEVGHIGDLETAIKHHQQALQATLRDASDLPSRLSNLGIALHARHERSGSLVDLEKSLEVVQQAVDTTPKGSPNLHGYLNNLGNILLSRYQRTGRIDDIDEAIKVLRRAEEAVHIGSPDLPVILNGLGTGLMERNARTGRVDDLDEAVYCYRRAVEATPGTSKALPYRLNNLGNGLSTGSPRSVSIEKLEEAIDAYRRACDLSPQDAPHLHKFLSNLGTGLRDRYVRKGHVGDLDAAIDKYSRAVKITPEGSHELPGYLNNLGEGLLLRHKCSGSHEDLDAGVRAFEQACVGGLNLNPRAAVIASRTWSTWAMERRAWEETARAADYGMKAMELVYRVQIARSAKESWMREDSGLHARAAYALACPTGEGGRSDLKGAILAAEWGRARLLTEVLDRDRADLDAARLSDPAAVERYENVAALVRGTEFSDPKSLRLSSVDPRPIGERIRESRAALEEAASAIRALPGQAEFLRAPAFEDLEQALEVGVPVVYFVVTEAGSVALIALRDESQTHLEAVWARSLTESRLREMAVGRGTAPRLLWQGTLSETMRQLWDLLMGTLVERLETLGASEAVLIPSGLLGLMPLHAAWTDRPKPRTALDAVAFRYVPSLRALQHACRLARAGTAGAFLSVCEPKSNGSADLPYAPVEVKAITSLFGRQVSLNHEGATHAAVVDALPRAGIAHFSCHGAAKWEEPLQSGLLMANNERLTVQDLFALRLPGARMAVLSACETAVPGTDLPDEVVALPAAFLQAGFAGAVASLWSVNDLSTALLMIRFYELWQKEGLKPVFALQKAQIWLRDTTNAEKLDHFDRRIPKDYSARLPANSAASVLFKMEVEFAKDQRDLDARDFAHPVWWAAFTLTGV